MGRVGSAIPEDSAWPRSGRTTLITFYMADIQVSILDNYRVAKKHPSRSDEAVYNAGDAI